MHHYLLKQTYSFHQTQFNLIFYYTVGIWITDIGITETAVQLIFRSPVFRSSIILIPGSYYLLGKKICSMLICERFHKGFAYLWKADATIAYFFKGVSVRQRSTRQARNLVACWSILCQLFAQDWPNLRWDWFNNVEVDSISTLQVTVL